MNLTTATPAEIDTRAAELDSRHATLVGLVAASMETIHRAGGSRITRHGGRKGWDRDDEDAITSAREMVARGVKPWEVNPTGALARLDEAEREIIANRAEMDTINAEYARRPWSRYVTVAGGHIHSGVWCRGGTIRATTTRVWTPQLSGTEVADAVAKLGPLLCSHCFPLAPVEWRADAAVAKSSGCAGSGRAPKSGSLRPRGASGQGACVECGAAQTLTTRGVVRKHAAA